MDLDIDKKIALEHQTERLIEYGEDVRAVGWSSVESQEARSKVLSEMGDFNNKTVLDAGCGFGDFYSFLKDRGIHPRKYIGIDFNPDILRVARKKLPDVKFELRDILDSELKGRFDFVIASGIFGLEMPHWQVVVEKQLSKMYELCEVGVGANFLSCYTTGEKFSDSHYADPAEILEFILKNLSNRVVLRHEYRQNDFTVYVYRDKVRK